jgi:uncharacterized protein YdaU (DUF1376 family)
MEIQMMKVPMMPTFPDSVLAVTAEMTLEEKGALWDLMNHMWRQEGWLKDDDVRIARLLRVSQNKWQKLKITLSPWLHYEAERFTNLRLLDDYQHALQRIEQNRLNGQKGGRKTWQNNDRATATASPNAIAKQWPPQKRMFEPTY